MNDVDPVGEEVGDLAAAEIEVGAPVVELLRVEVAVLGRAEEGFPVEPRRLLGEVGLAQVVAVAVPPGADERHLAELARVDDLALGFAVMLAAPLLQADLEDAPAALQ